ncbi:hypothetical protein NA56DRAFT_643041 [Hyaloscypha hepaticicola]|uniref:Uncharacterized protein n=1 Tax=Hyaloscypha hepaticicola TaxID=2082293 RepID=A0A2J6QDX3_9HELO|nr:hypothetical protein NA56DRAFT_643041 [Hyaloscypha hepaticicola]
MASNIESLLLSANNWWMFNVRSAFGICFTLTFYALSCSALQIMEQNAWLLDLAFGEGF